MISYIISALKFLSFLALLAMSVMMLAHWIIGDSIWDMPIIGQLAWVNKINKSRKDKYEIVLTFESFMTVYEADKTKWMISVLDSFPYQSLVYTDSDGDEHDIYLDIPGCFKLKEWLKNSQLKDAYEEQLKVLDDMRLSISGYRDKIYRNSIVDSEKSTKIAMNTIQRLKVQRKVG